MLIMKGGNSLSMEQLSRNGHRQRMRTLYLSGGMENVPDHNLLELFLSLVIPQRDVKPLAYDLMNTFGSLENVISANPDDLMQVKGIGESTAVAISLIKTINKRVMLNRNNNITIINSFKTAKEYCKNILQNETVEKLLLVTLDNSGNVINHHTIVEGDVSHVRVDYRKITEYVIRDKAVGIVISHNHPAGTAEPSAADINATMQLYECIKNLNVSFLDHVIVGKNECKTMKEYPHLKNMLS